MTDLNDDDEEPTDLSALHVEMVCKMIGRPARCFACDGELPSRWEGWSISRAAG